MKYVPVIFLVLQVTTSLKSIFEISYNVQKKERHKYQVLTQSDHFSEIPKRFELNGDNAVATFKKYATSIQNLASKDNSTVNYKVTVEIGSKWRNHKAKKWLKKPKSKKFNVPLKKKNMKLSSFEITLRKRVNDNIMKQQLLIDDTIVTTEQQKIIQTSKQWNGGKYKPIIRAVKTNYTKVIRPVRNKDFTLRG